MDRNDIKIYELKRMDLKGATVIDGFPSVGLVSSIAANYLIKVLDMEHIGIMDSIHFPTVSLIRDAKPLSPVRIYAGRKGRGGDQIVAFISEFQAPPNLMASNLASDAPASLRSGCRFVLDCGADLGLEVLRYLGHSVLLAPVLGALLKHLFHSLAAGFKITIDAHRSTPNHLRHIPLLWPRLYGSPVMTTVRKPTSLQERSEALQFGLVQIGRYPVGRSRAGPMHQIVALARFGFRHPGGRCARGPDKHVDVVLIP